MSDLDQVRINARAKLYDDLAFVVWMVLLFSVAIATRLLGVR